jgi:hypothetical protein
MQKTVISNCDPAFTLWARKIVTQTVSTRQDDSTQMIWASNGATQLLASADFGLIHCWKPSQMTHCSRAAKSMAQRKRQLKLPTKRNILVVPQSGSGIPHTASGATVIHIHFYNVKCTWQANMPRQADVRCVGPYVAGNGSTHHNKHVTAD